MLELFCSLWWTGQAYLQVSVLTGLSCASGIADVHEGIIKSGPLIKEWAKYLFVYEGNKKLHCYIYTIFLLLSPTLRLWMLKWMKMLLYKFLPSSYTFHDRGSILLNSPQCKAHVWIFSLETQLCYQHFSKWAL